MCAYNQITMSPCRYGPTQCRTKAIHVRVRFIVLVLKCRCPGVHVILCIEYTHNIV